VLKLSILLTKKEEVILTGHYTKSHTALIRQRAHATLLLNQGRTVPDIALILLVHTDTVRSWVHAFEDTRIASIFPHYTENTNASLLTEEQREEIKKTLAQPPSKKGIPGLFWSVRALKTYLSARYGVVYESDRSYHHLFELVNFSYKLPDALDKRRDDALVLKRMKEIRAEITTLKDYEVFAADESSIVWETELRRAWLQKGEKTILKVDRTKQRQNYFGALNLVSQRHHLIPLVWQNTETMIEALRILSKAYPHKNLCIIWDNASWHRSKGLRALLGTGNEFSHIRLIWMPPYAPDENPEEHVWKFGKEAIANRVYSSFKELTETFETAVGDKSFQYQMS
jgi:transposase